MPRNPDIELTNAERSLLNMVKFGQSTPEEIRKSITHMAELARSLLQRDAIPEVRKLYFTDPERNPGGRGKSRQQVFEANNTSGPKIIEHPHFLPYLYYFIYGPRLQQVIINEFKEVSASSGHLSEYDIQDLMQQAKTHIKELRLDPHTAAEEFHKLALEYGAMPNSAAMLWKHLRSVHINQSR
jgi:hypothetical protein